MDRSVLQAGWPFSDTSTFLDVDGLTWHVQSRGSGPVCLFLHGAGASTHSMQPLMSEFANTHTVIAVDLPGHGFTNQPNKEHLGLGEMTADIGAFLHKQSLFPQLIVAHSASAAIAMRLALDDHEFNQVPIVSINGALGNFRGMAGTLFPIFAKVLASTSLTAKVFASVGRSKERVRNVLASTGSYVSDESLSCYHKLMSDPEHVGNTLGMMAQWSLDRLLLELPKLQNPVLLMAGAKDLAVPPDTAEKIAKKMPNAVVRTLDGLGHLAHEEDPARIAYEIRDFLQGLTPDR